MTRRSLAVLGWLAAVVVATLAGVGALRLVGDSLAGTPGGVRSQADVARELAAVNDRAPATTPPIPTPSSSPTEGATAPPVDDVQRETFSIRGGTVLASCEGDLASLETWTPKDGWAVRDEDRGPEREVEVKFESDDDQSEIKIQCEDGLPVQAGHDD